MSTFFTQSKHLVFVLSISVLLSVMCIFLMTAEYDEAWVLASARQAFLPDALPQVEPVTTTGGIHFYIVGLLSYLPFDPLVSARLVSFVSVILLFALVYFQADRWFPSRTEKLIILATCAATPGTILLAGMGFAIPVAVLLFLAGVYILARNSRTTLTSAIVGGVLIGTALATRWPLIPALPCILLIVIGSAVDRRANLVAVIVAGLTAVGIFLAFFFLQIRLLDGTGPQSGVSLEGNAEAAGISLSLALPNASRLLGNVTTLVATLPITLLTVAVLGCFAIPDKAQLKRVMIILLAAAMLVAVALILRSPAMLLRYVWAAYFFIGIVSGFGFAYLYQRSDGPEAFGLRLFSLWAPFFFLSAQIVIALRLIAIGAAAQVNEAGHENLANHFSSLYLHQEEQEMIAYMAATPPDTVFATLTLPREQSWLELSFLSQRRVHNYSDPKGETDVQPDVLITHRFSGLNEAGQTWLTTLGPPARQIRGYTIYDVPEGTVIPSVEDFHIEMQLYRFGPEKWLSLTGWREW